MEEFGIIDVKRLVPWKRDEALKMLFSVYSQGGKMDMDLFRTYKRRVLKDEQILGMAKAGKIYGAVSYRRTPAGITVSEMCTKPSVEYLRENGTTIGHALYTHVKNIADKNGLEFRASFVRSGIRAKKRLSGKLPKKPKRPQKRR